MTAHRGVDPPATNSIVVDEDSIVNEVGNSEVCKVKVNAKIAKSKSQDKSKGKNSVKFLVKALTQSLRSDFLTPRDRKAFTKLTKAFIETSIFYHFDPDCHIRIETDASSYVICGVFSKLTLDNLS